MTETTTAPGVPDPAPVDKATVLKAGTLVAGSQALVLVGQMVSSLILARALTPEVFGVYGVVMLVVLFADTVLMNLGVVAALVQRPKISDTLVDSVFWVTVAIGVGSSVLIVAGAPYFGPAMGSEAAVGPLQLTAVMYLFAAPSLVPRALLRRRMQYRSVVLANTLSAAINSIGAVGLALTGLEVWALAIPNVVATLVASVIVCVAARYRPRRRFSRHELRDLRSYGRNYGAVQVLNYLATQGDRVIVGQLGERALGLYSQTNRLMMYPSRLMAVVSTEVLFPALSRIQDDLARLRRVYIDGLTVLTAALVPVFVSLAVFAGPFVNGVLGPKWADSVVLVVLLGPAWGITTLLRLTGAVLQAKGRADLQFRWTLGATILLGACYLVGLIWGVNGVAAGYLIGSVLLLPPSLWIVCRVLEMRLVLTLRPLVPVMAAGAVMIAAQWAYASVVRGSNDLVVLLTGSTVGTAVYMSVFLVVWRGPTLELVARVVGNRRIRRRV